MCPVAPGLTVAAPARRVAADEAPAVISARKAALAPSLFLQLCSRVCETPFVNAADWLGTAGTERPRPAPGRPWPREMPFVMSELIISGRAVTGPDELEVCRWSGSLHAGHPGAPGDAGRWAQGWPKHLLVFILATLWASGFDAPPAGLAGLGEGGGMGKGGHCPCGRDSGQLPGPPHPHRALLQAPR